MIMFWLVIILAAAITGYFHYRLCKKTYSDVFNRLSNCAQLKKKGGEK